MTLKVVGTGSKGNCYLLEAETTGEILMIECGLYSKDILKAIRFETSRVVGCLVSHSHADHAGSMAVLADLYSINIITSTECAKQWNLQEGSFLPIDSNPEIKVGTFKVISFDLVHDVPCKGFMIYHDECGSIAFITDTRYCPVKFNCINHLIIEANYCEKKITGINEWLRNRIVKSHMSIQNCLDFIDLNDKKLLYNVIFTHLSDSNSDELEFLSMANDRFPDQKFYAADKNFELTLLNNPF